MREADAMVVRRVGNRHGCVVAVLIYAVSVLTVPPKLGLWLCRNCCVFVAMHLPSHAVTFLKETMTQGWKATVVLGFSVNDPLPVFSNFSQNAQLSLGT